MKYRILANDGIADSAKQMLEANNIEVVTERIEQENLIPTLNDFDGIIVRSATKVRKDLIDNCPNCKFIGRAGVGMDNIDVDYARSIGRFVANTPNASSQSVAELVFAHMFGMARFLHNANRDMPTRGQTDFKSLKKSFAKGVELRGKTLGIIGFGRIGQAVARMALGLGMNVMPFNLDHDKVKIDIDFFKIKDASISITLETDPYDRVLAESDFITLHVPALDKPLLGKKEFGMMKEGVCVVNTSRGGVIDEAELLDALNSGKVKHAALDVFENEPSPSGKVLAHSKISLSPHIGASTTEAQHRIGMEMAERIIAYFDNL